MITVIQALSPNLMRVSYHGHQALWSVRDSRKVRACACCCTDIPVGREVFGSIGNQQYRRVRICGVCMQGLARRAA